MKKTLASFAFLLAACGGSDKTSAPPSSPNAPVPTAKSEAPAPSASAPKTALPSKQQRLIGRTLDRVVHLRKIDAKKDVPGKVLDREALIARVKEHVDKEVPPEAIEREGTTLKLLGFVPNTFDYGKELFALLKAQLAGYYEPEDGTMYMASDLDGMNAEATLAHELVHALQDQHWDLKQRSKYKEGQSDKTGALAALAEGDATSAMADYIVSRMDPAKTALDVPEDLFTEQVAGAMNSGDTADAPHVMRTSLIAPYVDGLLFVNGLRRKGGWELVNKAWEQLPESTEQILHIDKWVAKEPPLLVTHPTAASLGAGFKISDEDTYGEQQMALMFEEWMGREEARSAASGWGGDRGAIWSGDGKTAIAVHVRYDAAKGATKDVFAERAFRSVTAGLTKLGTVKREGSFVCLDRKELGPIAVRREGRELVLVAGPAKFGPGAPAAAGDCVLAKAWTREVAGNP